MKKEKTLYLLEKEQVFSRSLLWGIQERYFSEKGVDAWRQGEVPHYVTSNPTIANSYAEIVFAFYSDRQHLATIEGAAFSDEPFYLCELGAGSGRFAFHFLNRLSRLCEQTGISPATFKYVLTDMAESNLEFWKSHPSFQSYFESGMLDVAQFDLNKSDTLTLHHSGQLINAGSLHHPLIVIGNYIFDSVPQELYYINEKKCFECLMTVASDEQPQPEGAADLINSLHYKYDYKEVSETPFEEEFLQEIIDSYKSTLSNTHLFFPATSLRSLQRLKNLSKEGMLLLSADKGDHNLAGIEHAGAPVLVHHGSFSITVNYHAFKLFCEQKDGLALFPDRSFSSVNMGCLLFLPQSKSYTETRRAYQRQVVDFGPDDFYKLSRNVFQQAGAMSAEDILSYIRLGYYDSHLFLLCVHRLAELVLQLNETQHQAIKSVLEEVWAIYFPLGEHDDLAWHIAGLYYEMDDLEKAIYFFERSLEIYGPYSGTLCNLAVCCELMGEYEKAKNYLLQVLEAEPENSRAKEMLNEKSNETGPIILASIHNHGNKNSTKENSKAVAHELNNGKKSVALHAPVHDTQSRADETPPVKPLLLPKGIPIQGKMNASLPVVQMKAIAPAPPGVTVEAAKNKVYVNKVLADAKSLWKMNVGKIDKRSDLLIDMAAKAGAVGEAIGAVGNWTETAVHIGDEGVAGTVDPVLLKMEGKYKSTVDRSEKDMKLDYHFGKHWHGYVIKVVDAGQGLSQDMKPVKESQIRGSTTEFSNIHAVKAKPTRPLEEDPGADEITKLAGEGARWNCIRSGIASIADDTKIYTNENNAGVPDGKVRQVTFPVLWKSWAATFAKKFNIPNDTVVDKLKASKMLLREEKKAGVKVIRDKKEHTIREVGIGDIKFPRDISVDNPGPTNADGIKPKSIYQLKMVKTGDAVAKPGNVIGTEETNFKKALDKIEGIVVDAGHGYAGTNAFMAICTKPDASLFTKAVGYTVQTSTKLGTYPAYREAKAQPKIIKPDITTDVTTGRAAFVIEQRKLDYEDLITKMVAKYYRHNANYNSPALYAQYLKAILNWTDPSTALPDAEKKIKEKLDADDLEGHGSKAVKKKSRPNANARRRARGRGEAGGGDDVAL